MKIISNFKDYYDHQVATFGIDPMVNYERVCWQLGRKDAWEKKGVYKPSHLSFTGPEAHNKFFFELIAFCGTIYAVGMYKGRAYYGEDMNEIPPFYSGKRGTMDECRWADSLPLRDYHRLPTDLNRQHNCPAILLHHTYGHPRKLYAFVKNPRLADYGFSKVVSPQYAWTSINNFFLHQPEIPNTQTDKEKISAHGFDLKHSFRNTK